MAGQDVVYANLAGDPERMANSVVTAMHETRVRRLIRISSMGIYDEVPGETPASWTRTASPQSSSRPRISTTRS